MMKNVYLFKLATQNSHGTPTFRNKYDGSIRVIPKHYQKLVFAFLALLFCISCQISLVRIKRNNKSNLNQVFCEAISSNWSYWPIGTEEALVKIQCFVTILFLLSLTPLILVLQLIFYYILLVELALQWRHGYIFISFQ